MAWHDDDYKYRIPICPLPQTTASYDLTLSIDTTWDLFWDNIDANGDGIRVTSANGVNTVQYTAGFVVASRSGTVSLDAVSLTTDIVPIYWLYWKQGTPTNNETALTIASAESLMMLLADPESEGVVIDADAEEPPDSTASPMQRLRKATDTDLVVWWRIPLGRAVTPMNGRDHWEELARVDLSDSGMFTGASTQYYKPGSVHVVEKDGVTYVRQQYVGGVSGTDYTLRLAYVTTGYGQSSDTEVAHVARAYLDVYDATE